MRFENPYEILGLSSGASEEEVKAAYEKLLCDEEKKEQAEAAYRQITEETEVPENREEVPSKETAAPEEETPQEAAGEAEKSEDVSAKEDQTKKGATPGQIALGVLAVVVLAAVLVALILAALGGREEAPADAIPETTVSQSAEAPVPEEPTEATIPADGNPADVTAKGSYSVSDEEALAAADTVVASIADRQLTNAQLQIYYWMSIQNTVQSNPYLSYMGLDLSRGISGLDTQKCALAEGLTWQQFFLDGALKDWQLHQAMAMEAEQAGVALPAEMAEMLKDLPQELEKQAKENGFESGLALLQHNAGVSARVEDYVGFVERLEVGHNYCTQEIEKKLPTDADLEAYLKEHEEELKEGGITKDSRVASVRHILIAPEDTESEESWKKAEQAAKDLLDQFLAGDKSEESFGKLAEEHTMDPGSKETGGLYTDFLQGQMVPEFDQWSFDAARKNGDTGIVKTEFGYHIMFYVGSRSVWKEQVSQIYMQEVGDNLISDGISRHPMDVDYSAIVLGTPKEQ